MLVICLGAVAGVIFAWLVSPAVAALVGWCVGAAVYLLSVWVFIWPKDAEQTARLALYEDGTRTTADLLLLNASLASLLAVALAIARATPYEWLTLTLAVASVALAWAVVHTVYTLRYARLYYAGTDSGVDFGDESPSYVDFAYLALTIGMTYQVSDTTLQSREFRRAALPHALLSYVFGTGILATTINLVVNLSVSGR